MLPALYILLVSTLFVLTERYAPKPKFVNIGFMSGMVLLGWFLSVAFIGWHLPTLLHEKTGWGFAPEWLVRCSQVFGAIGGFMIALRGAVIMGYAVLVWIIGAIALTVIGYVAGI